MRWSQTLGLSVLCIKNIYSHADPQMWELVINKKMNFDLVLAWQSYPTLPAEPLWPWLPPASPLEVLLVPSSWPFLDTESRCDLRNIKWKEITTSMTIDNWVKFNLKCSVTDAIRWWLNSWVNIWWAPQEFLHYRIHWINYFHHIP